MVIAGVLRPDLDCTNCKAGQKIERGCDAPSPVPISLPGVTLTGRCPMRPYFEDPEGFNELFSIYQWHLKGFLPEPGGYMDQAHRLVRLIECVDKAAADGKRALHEAEERKAKQRAQAQKFTSGRRPPTARGRRGPR